MQGAKESCNVAPKAAPTRATTAVANGRPPFVLILGMHRSGTSLCSHLLDTLGVDMADDPAPHHSNRKGHWERGEIVALHDRILGLFNRGYGTPAHDLQLPDQWWADPGVRQIEREIMDFLQKRKAGSVPFGFKDPRAARLLPLWHRIFAELELNPRIVLCVRNPAQVARSLNDRDELPHGLGEYRWFSYMAEVFGNLRNCEVCLIEFEEWFSEERNAEKLVRFIGLEKVGSSELRAAVSHVVDPELRHDDDKVVARAPLLRSFYALVRQYQTNPAAQQEIRELIARFAAFRGLYQPLELEFDHLARLAAELPVGDNHGFRSIQSWRHPAFGAAWNHLLSEARATGEFRLRRQNALIQRAEPSSVEPLDAGLSRREAGGAASTPRHGPIDEGEEQTIDAGNEKGDASPDGRHFGGPLEILAQTHSRTEGTFDPLDVAELIQAVLDERSSALIDRLTDVRSENAEFNYILSLKLLDAGFPENSERAARHSVQHGPKEAKYYERLGSILALRGNREEAIGMLRIACELADDWSYPRERLMTLLAEEEPRDQA